MFLSFSIFDLGVGLALIVSAWTGFNAGLVRSFAVILGYIFALPLAVTVTTRFSPTIEAGPAAPWAQNTVLFFGVFLVSGLVIGALLKVAVNDLLGSDVSPADRVAGLLLGLIRIVLVAITAVVALDRIIPADRQPAFLQGSELRPILSQMGQQGLRTLPPDIATYIDQLKKDRKI